MSTYYNHLREITASDKESFGETSHLSRALAYSYFLADNPDFYDDILVEPTQYLTQFRLNLLNLLANWDVELSVHNREIIPHLQAEFFVMCETNLFEKVSEDYEEVRQETFSS